MLRTPFMMMILLAFFPLATFAQGMQWGSGQWGGSQGCSYAQQQGKGAVSDDDPLQELLAEIQETKQQLKIKKSELKQVDKLADRAHSKVDETLSPDYASLVFSHIENNNRCSEYQGLNLKSGGVAGAQGQEPVGGSAQANMLEVVGMTTEEWSKYCDPAKAGSVRDSVCLAGSTSGETRRADPKSCRKALTDYRKNYADGRKIATEIEDLQQSLDGQKQDLADLKKDLREEARDASTQGDYCEECNKRGNGYTFQQPQTNWGSVLANVGTGLAASYMGYKANQTISENNANLGFPTANSNYSALGYGMPFYQAGLYGALSGSTGQGSFGCGSNSNMAGSPFGYPQGMMGNSMGGGMYMGSNPMMMGMNGMNGMGGMGNMMSGGMMMSGGLGMMSGMGLMSSGMMSSGMMSNGMGLMSSGMMNSGMMVSGNMGMMTGMGMMLGYGSMTDSSSMALQSQLMQMQYQQQAAKSSTMGSLQSELYSLIARIQQVQYGSSNYLGTGVNSSYANGALPAPSSSIYNSYGTSTGALPAPGNTSSGTTYYGR